MSLLDRIELDPRICNGKAVDKAPAFRCRLF